MTQPSVERLVQFLRSGDTERADAEVRAMVERGVDPEPLGRALLDHVERAAAAARAAAEHLAQDAPVEEDEDAESAAERDHEFADQHPEVHAALQALDRLCYPAVTTWSRLPLLLKDARERAELANAIDHLAPFLDGVGWLRVLLRAAQGEPFIAVFPEIDEWYVFQPWGVASMGQLSVLLTEHFTGALERIGASGRASDAMLDLMKGEGPQQIDGAYASSFHIYPWQAIDPADGHPKDARFVWTAPGGAGFTSLPQDFLPCDVAPIGDTRIVAIVGPSNGLRFTRVLGGTRPFATLRARIEGVRRLDPDGTRDWKKRLQDALAGVTLPEIEPELTALLDRPPPRRDEEPAPKRPSLPAGSPTPEQPTDPPPPPSREVRYLAVVIGVAMILALVYALMSD